MQFYKLTLLNATPSQFAAANYLTGQEGGKMSYYECRNCGFSTDDASMPDCPHCGGYLSEKDDEVIACDDSKTMEELYY